MRLLRPKINRKFVEGQVSNHYFWAVLAMITMSFLAHATQSHWGFYIFLIFYIIYLPIDYFFIVKPTLREHYERKHGTE